MKMSRTITLKVLAGLTLTGCLAASGCGGAAEGPSHPDAVDMNEPVDETWYDENGNVVAQQWQVNEHGQRVLDAEGRPIPEPGVPRDRHGHLWVYHHGAWVPPVIVFGPSYRSGSVYHSGPVRSSSWVTGGSGYRTPSTTTPYRAPSGVGSGPVHTTTPARPSPSAGPPAGSSISRSGFGSTGAASSSSASS